jgi:hypothetical protein
MNDNRNRTSQAGEPCFALRKKASLASFVIAGAAALCVGLAGNVQAIPFPMHGDLDAGNSWNLRHDQSDYETVRSLNQSNRKQSLAGPTANLSFRSVPAQSAGEFHNFSSWNSHHDRQGVPRTPPGQDRKHSPATVPEGGSSGLLLGGVFCGLALLVKKLKA